MAFVPLKLGFARYIAAIRKLKLAIAERDNYDVMEQWVIYDNIATEVESGVGLFRFGAWLFFGLGLTWLVQLSY